ncbi:MAG TPA: right-handed parallel beta-helix repeat-containing protein [Stellaceae bacterium]
MALGLLLFATGLGGSSHAGAPLPSSAYWGPGKTTLTCIDVDGDGYGTGPGCSGPDADDDDPAVNTVATWQAKYRNLDALLAKRGYAGILRYWFLDYGRGSDATCAPGPSAVAQAHPCRTWQHIRSAGIRPGDVIMLRAGITPQKTTFPISVSGTAANPIALIGYPGERFTLDRSGGPDGISGERISYLILDGLKISSTNDLGNEVIINYPHHVTIRNMELAGGYTLLRMFEDTRDVLIEQNIFHDSLSTEGIYLGSRGLPGNNVIFQYNIIFNASNRDSGYASFQYNGRIKNLTIQGNIVYGGEQCFSWLEGVSNSSFRNNVCFNNNRALLTIHNYPGDQKSDCTCSTNAICPYDQTNNVIENNTLVRPQYNRWHDLVSGTPFIVNNASHCTLGDLGHNTWRNNIIYGYGSDILMSYKNSDRVARKYIATSVFENNLWYLSGESDKVFRIGEATSFTDYTLTSFAPLAKMFTGNMLANPLFKRYSESNYAAPTADNFHLQPGSSAVRAGGSFGLTTDIQRLRQTAPPTIGAYAQP